MTTGPLPVRYGQERNTQTRFLHRPVYQHKTAAAGRRSPPRWRPDQALEQQHPDLTIIIPEPEGPRRRPHTCDDYCVKVPSYRC